MRRRCGGGGWAVAAAAGVAAAAVILALPRLAASRRAAQFRVGRWLAPRTTSRRLASEAWLFVSACWAIRGVAVFLLLGTLGIGFSLPLALLFLCAGAAAAALPIGPAGAAMQAGAGAGALMAAGVGASPAVAVALAGGGFPGAPAGPSPPHGRRLRARVGRRSHRVAPPGGLARGAKRRHADDYRP